MSEQDRFGSIRLSPETIKAREMYAKKRLARTAVQVSEEIRSERQDRLARETDQVWDAFWRGLKLGFRLGLGFRR